MDKRTVEFLEDVQGIAEAGDINTYPKARADVFIDAGWAKCTKTGESCERVPGAGGVIQPNNVVQKLGE